MKPDGAGGFNDEPMKEFTEGKEESGWR